MLKIAKSLMMIGVVAALAIGVTGAFFSDTETSTGNYVRAGMIDLTVNGENPLESAVVTLDDMKPGYEKIITKYLTVTNNPSNVWMQIADVVGLPGDMSEPECKAEGGTWVDYGDNCAGGMPIDDLETQIYYDLTVCIDDGNGTYGSEDECIVIYSFDEQEKETLASLNNKWIQLAQNLPANRTVWIFQSFHFNEEAGNEYQGDRIEFTENFAAYQLEAPGPYGGESGIGILKMENKDSNWNPLYGDGTKGTLEYNLAGETFDYTFDGQGLQTSTEYCLIYYADCDAAGWPGDGSTHDTGALIGKGNTNGGTTLSLGASVELGTDLPNPTDYNYPAGAKIWLVPCSDYSATGAGNQGNMIGWNPTQYLFENDPVLIQYDDTQI